MRGHGDRSQLEVTEAPEPVVANDGGVKVRVKAAALNHLDLWTLKGLPGCRSRFPTSSAVTVPALWTKWVMGLTGSSRGTE